MALANIFQKLRASAPATAVTALAGFLTLATPFSNATAQEPMRTSHHPQTAHMPQHHQPTIMTQAGDYSENNKAIGIIVSKGRKDEGGLTGDQMGNMIRDFFINSEGITSKTFVGPSTADYTAIGFMVKGVLYGPVTLSKAKAMATVAAHDFAQAYGIMPEMAKAVAPVADRE